MDEMSQKRVAIIIPVFNQLEHTRECIETLLADPLRPDYEVLVINNNSTDGTREYLEQWQERIAVEGKNTIFRIITNEKNIGVAPAWNQGIQATSAPWLAILNNDIVLTVGWWQNLFKAIHQFSFDLASPFVLEGNKPQNFQAWAERFRVRNQNQYWCDYSFVAFACRRTLIDRVGLFDENFRVGGFEDTDYIYRLRKEGLRYGIVGNSIIYHYGSQTLREFKKLGDQHAIENLRYFQAKWQVDPRLEYSSEWKRMGRRWRRWKLRLGYM